MWRQVGWVFTLMILFGGVCAAIFGKWLEKKGPRLSGG
jgi:hypothetical protein